MKIMSAVLGAKKGGHIPMKSLNTKNPPEVVVEDEPQHYLFPEIAHYKKRAFLSALAVCGSAQKAGNILKWKDDRMHYYWLHSDPAYAAAVDRARQIAASNIEDKLYELGVNGYDKPVLYEGRITATYKEYSVTSLIFLAKGNNHEKYRENFRDSNGGGWGPTCHDPIPPIQSIHQRSRK